MLSAVLPALALLLGSPSKVPPRRVALTFDDLPAAGAQNAEENAQLPTSVIRDINRSIIAALRKHHAPAIGFVNERGISESPDTSVRRAILGSWTAAGLELGNHTYSHADANKLTAQEFGREIEKGEASIRPLMRAAGREATFFRFPYNHTGEPSEKRALIASFLKQRGYRLAVCTIDTEDFEFERAFRLMSRTNDRPSIEQLKRDYLEYTSAEIDYYTRLHAQVFGHETAQVMLLHANSLNAVMLDAILSLFERKNYRFVSLATAQGDPAFATPVTESTRFGPMWGYRWAKSLGVTVDGSKETEPPRWITHYGRD